MHKLSEQDRQFFGLVARAAFANPFGHERQLLDGEIAETDADAPDVLPRLGARLSRRLDALCARDRGKLDEYGADDRELLRAGVLFYAFHRYLDELDQLIASEERARGPAKVGFAKSYFQLVQTHGIVGREAVRMLELFYQIRRAHSFIRDRLVGLGPSMRRVREELWNAVFTTDIRRYERYLWNRMEDFSLLILGETGTGKGQAALAVGCSSYIPFDEARGSFLRSFVDGLVPLNLSAFPETLIESELFGHRKGAFTGAVDQHDGALARVAPYGSIFLDEIGEVSTALQVKLLRVLSERTYSEVGGHAIRRFEGRVLAATHRSIDELRAEGHMREDFFYRLCACTVTLPPLRVRIAEDPRELDALVSHITARVLGEPSTEMAEQTVDAIRNDLGDTHSFDGNVRELEQCVRRVLLTGHCGPDARRARTGQAGWLSQVERGSLSAEQLLAHYCGMLYGRTGSYVEVAQITGLDRRTVKKHVEASRKADEPAFFAAGD